LRSRPPPAPLSPMNAVEFTCRLRKDEFEKLKALASDEKTSVKRLARKAIGKFLIQSRRDAETDTSGLDRFLAGADTTMTIEEKK
jgi:predicted transcriptional regulator